MQHHSPGHAPCASLAGLTVPALATAAVSSAPARRSGAIVDATSLIRHRLPTWAIDQLAWPLLAFLVANLALIVLGGDRWIADHVFAAEGGRWALQDSYVTTTLIHIAGKRLSTLAWLLAMAATLLAWRVPRLRALRTPLALLTVSVLLSTVLVSTLKHWTHMDCPWDMQPYGGLRPYLDLFDARPAGMKASGCFPAGHSSAGYAWVALYFFALAVAPRWRWRGLWCGLGAGLIFGLSQQLRGAHFMSHDVWTLMLCWLTAVLVHRVPWSSWRRWVRASRRGPSVRRAAQAGGAANRPSRTEPSTW